MNLKNFIKRVFVLCLLALPLNTVADDFQRGDVNHDGSVNVSDVTFLISYLLNNQWPDVPSQVKTFTANGVSFKMMPVQGGTFTMGAAEEQSDALDNEMPAHEVTLSSFYMGETEVTQKLWLAVMGTNPSSFTGNLLRPVERVSWNDCQAFITKLNALTGQHFRLPTEAEWEFAARGGNQSHGFQYSGDNNIDMVAWYIGNSGSQTHPVASKQANELGLYDMSGNVWEWCQDWYDDHYYSNSPSDNPSGPETGLYRVDRGGCWFISAARCRVTYRGNCSPSNAYYNNGLRLAL